MRALAFILSFLSLHLAVNQANSKIVGCFAAPKLFLKKGHFGLNQSPQLACGLGKKHVQSTQFLNKRGGKLATIHHSSGDPVVDANVLDHQKEKRRRKGARAGVRELLDAALWSLQNGKRQGIFDDNDDDNTCYEAKELPATNASFVSKATFSWVSCLMKQGNTKPLEEEDLWELPKHQQMAHVSEEFDQCYQNAVDNKNKFGWPVPKAFESPIVYALWRMHKGTIFKTAVFRFFNTCVQFFPAVLVARILKILEKGVAGSIQQGYLLAGCLFVMLLSKTVLENQYFYNLSMMGMQIRAALSTAVYRKALRLSPAARQSSTTGELVNYMQLDSSRIEDVALQIHVIWDGLFQIFGFSALLVYYLGISVLPGIFLITLLIPINSVCYRKLTVFRAMMLKKSDSRIKLTNEVISGMRAIKFYNWEVPFASKLEKIRGDELQIYKASAVLRSLLTSATSATPAIVSTVTLILYSIWTKELLQPSKIFTALSLFNQIRLPLLFYPWVLSALADGKVSLSRLDKFLKAPEVESYVEKKDGAGCFPPQTAIALKDGTFTWNVKEDEGETDEDDVPTLRGLNMNVKEGQLVAVVGLVGSGKSSVISALMGEMHKLCGRVMVKGKIAYVPQTPWIPHDTLQNNICFGEPFEQDTYDHVVDACSLTKDIQLLQDGDQTEIGERGINLSGGQKQRLSIARAVYNNADVYLMDDPLSALDAEVGKDVFQKCIVQTLEKKTRILVTNQLQFLPQVDWVVLMGDNSDGSRTIIDQGSFKDLKRRGRNLEQLMKKAKEDEQIKVEEEMSKPTNSTEIYVADDLPADLEDELLGMNTTESTSTGLNVTVAALTLEIPSKVPEEKENLKVLESFQHFHQIQSEEEEHEQIEEHASHQSNETLDTSTIVVKSEPKKLLTTEDRARGAVKRSVYLDYLRTMKAPLAIGVMIVSYVVANGAQLAQQYVVSLWSSDPTYKKFPLAVYSGGVALMAVFVAAFNFFRTYLSLVLGIKASVNMHNSLLYRVMGAPTAFFDTTPLGRIVQRFSKDLDQVDQQLTGQIGMLITCALQMFGSGVAIISATPVFVVGVLPIVKIYTSVMNYFRAVSRELKRINAISRSPIYSHFGETLGGLSTVRAFAHEKRFAKKNERLVDKNLSTYFALKVVDRWLNMRLETLGNTICLSVALLSIYTASKGHLGAGLAGLALTQALSLTGLMNWAVRCLSETENMMSSVERVQFMATETMQEAPYIQPRPSHITSDLAILPDQADMMIPAQKVPLASDKALLNSGWPWQGQVTFNKVKMRYRPDTELVLKGVSLTIRPGEKVGVVGRTGSGKSTLMQVLFRMVEIESGQIMIDGVNTKLVGLSALRSKLTIIPQEPVLFSGTVKANLDPLEQFTDKEIWHALERASLAPFVRSLPKGLNDMVSEYGENFSAGQRQLICLARALLRKSKILLLDEATSSVDYETDALIQRTIREEFSDCTVLTIAHRLNTIMDSDKIIVMDQGRLAEFDSPSALLQHKHGVFTQLVKAEKKMKLEGKAKNIKSKESTPII